MFDVLNINTRALLSDLRTRQRVTLLDNFNPAGHCWLINGLAIWE